MQIGITGEKQSSLFNDAGQSVFLTTPICPETIYIVAKRESGRVTRSGGGGGGAFYVLKCAAFRCVDKNLSYVFFSKKKNPCR